MNMLDNLRRGELKRLLLHRRAASKVDVYNVVEDILGERVKWTSTALGRRMQLTFEEKVRLGIRTLRCIDRNANMMRLYYLERRRERDRRRAKKMRGQMAKEDEWFVGQDAEARGNAQQRLDVGLQTGRNSGEEMAAQTQCCSPGYAAGGDRASRGRERFRDEGRARTAWWLSNFHAPATARKCSKHGHF
jgi:hypothetical protein